jgi:hypothetical protein
MYMGLATKSSPCTATSNDLLYLRKEHRLRVCEKSGLRRIFGPKMDEVTEVGEKCIRRSFLTCTLHQVYLE